MKIPSLIVEAIPEFYKIVVISLEKYSEFIIKADCIWYECNNESKILLAA